MEMLYVAIVESMVQDGGIVRAPLLDDEDSQKLSNASSEVVGRVPRHHLSRNSCRCMLDGKQ